MKTLCVLGLGVALAGLGCSAADAADDPSNESEPLGVARSAATTVVDTGWQPVEGIGFNSCANEEYSFTGQHRTIVRTAEKMNGTSKIVTTDQIKGTGVGLVTGSRYVTSEPARMREIYRPDGAFSTDARFSAKLNALDNDVSDLRLEGRFVLAIDAAGNVTNSVDIFEVTCD